MLIPCMHPLPGTEIGLGVCTVCVACLQCSGYGEKCVNSVRGGRRVEDVSVPSTKAILILHVNAGDVSGRLPLWLWYGGLGVQEYVTCLIDTTIRFECIFLRSDCHRCRDCCKANRKIKQRKFLNEK